MKSLYEITGQESGIVVYDDKVIVTNWSCVCPDGGMPVMSPINTVMCWPVGDEIELLSDERVDDVRKALPGNILSRGKNEDGIEELELEDMEILSDENMDIPALWGYKCGDAYINRDEDGKFIPTAGKVLNVEYAGDEARVIVPDGWN